jgi:hypothetical protein
MDNMISKDMVGEWGLQNLPPEKQAEMVERIGKMMYQMILDRALDILTDEEQKDFDVLLDKEGTTPENILQFLASKISTFEQIVTEERLKLKKDLFPQNP